MDLIEALCNQNVFCRNKDSNFRLMQVSVDLDFYSQMWLCVAEIVHVGIRTSRQFVIYKITRRGISMLVEAVYSIWQPIMLVHMRLNLTSA